MLMAAWKSTHPPVGAPLGSTASGVTNDAGRRLVLGRNDSPESLTSSLFPSKRLFCSAFGARLVLLERCVVFFIAITVAAFRFAHVDYELTNCRAVPVPRATLASLPSHSFRTGKALPLRALYTFRKPLISSFCSIVLNWTSCPPLESTIYSYTFIDQLQGSRKIFRTTIVGQFHNSG
jgi:hypothetical protein